jgi:hypothetical protein
VRRDPNCRGLSPESEGNPRQFAPSAPARTLVATLPSMMLFAPSAGVGANYFGNRGAMMR